MLNFKTVREFMHQMNPCNFFPVYKEDCTRCMNKFCFDNNTTREEYLQKKLALSAFQGKVGELEGEILTLLRDKEYNPELVRWKAEQIRAIEKELEF